MSVAVVQDLRRPVTVAEAVLAELERLGAEGSALGVSALRLAVDVDSAGTSATARAMGVKELRAILDRVRELSPPAVEGDRVDELGSRRAKRRAKA